MTAVLALSAATVVQTAFGAAAATSTVSLFAGATPSVTADRDSQAVELGVKFSSDLGGLVSGVRFYKGSGNGGTHVGSLWSQTGQRLASATFTSESASGWQTVQFPSPVAVAPATTYVASYHTDLGHYAADENFFSQPVTSGPLHAPATTNGVYLYGATGFPSQTYNATNYYVDVLFSPGSSPAVTVAPPSPGPTVSSSPTSPAPTTTTAPVYGWQLNTSNTGLAGVGIDRTKLPLYTGAITAGMTLHDVRIEQGLDLRNIANVTLDRVWIRPTNGLSHTDILYLGAGAVVRDSDIDGSGTPSSSPARAGINTSTDGGYTIDRVKVDGVEVGIYGDSNGPGVIRNSLINADQSVNGNHNDGYTRRAGTGDVTISGSRLIVNVPGMTTGAFFLQDTWQQPIANVHLKDSIVEGLGYPLTLENHGSGTSVSLNNVRVSVYNSPDGYGPLATAGVIAAPEWTGVYGYAPALPNAAGAVIPAP